MKTCLLLPVCLCALAVSSLADSYTNALPAGFSAIANHLDNGNNTLDEVLPNVPPLTRLWKWTCSGWILYAFDDMELAWTPTGGTLRPGEGALIQLSGAAQLIFSGASPSVALPLALPCGCGAVNFVSRQDMGVGTFENIMGAPPLEGAQWLKWVGNAWVTNFFAGGAWHPSEPTNAIGESSIIIIPVGHGLSLTCASDKAVDSNAPWDFDSPVLHSFCCGTNTSLSVLSTVTNTAGCQMTATRTWQATDCQGATNTCSQTVTVVDTMPPAITCAINKTVECGSSWSFDEPTALDFFCGTNVTISVLSTITNGTCPAVITRTWQATDCCSNSTNCSQAVTVVDTTPPVITCPSNVAAEFDGCGGTAVSFPSPEVRDNCDPSPTVTFQPAAGTRFCPGHSTVTCWAVDSSGNSNACTFTVTVGGPPRPTLRLALAETNVTLCWEQTCTGFVLQETDRLDPPAWSYSSVGVAPIGNNYCATIPIQGEAKFYRLTDGQDTCPQVSGAVTKLYALLPNAYGLAFATNGVLYVGRDTLGFQTPSLEMKIWKVGQCGTPAAEFGDPISDPDGVWVDQDGVYSGSPGSVLVVLDYYLKGGAVWVLKPDGSTNALLGPSTSLSNPNFMVLDDSTPRRLLISDEGKEAVFVFLGTSVTKLFDLAWAGPIAVDSLNRIVATARYSNWASLFAPDGTPLTRYFAPTKESSPLARGPGDRFWGSDIYAVNSSNQLIRVDANGSATIMGSGFQQVTCLQFGPDNALYLAERNTGRIYRITKNP